MDVRRDATEYTTARNDALLSELPFEDRQDFEDASRGLIAPLPGGGTVRDATGRVVWDPTRFVLELTNGSLNHSLDRQDADEDITITTTRPVFSGVVLGELSVADATAKGLLAADPGPEPLEQLLGFDFWFNIVEPKAPNPDVVSAKPHG